MSARGFKSVFMVGAVAGAALSCYLVSLKVASERAALEGVETQIVLAQRDVRLLETEIGTRGRLAQLERWNVKAIQLSSPTADQFIDNGYQLATLVKPEPKPAIGAPVVLAAAPREIGPQRPVVTNDDADATPPAVAPRAPAEMMHVASYAKPAAAPPRPMTMSPVPNAGASIVKPAVTTKAVKTATADPLAPLSGAKLKAKSGANPKSTTKE